jgi:Immunoglobulin-like domain of bacterial spore germination/Sporulation and spore germination
VIRPAGTPIALALVAGIVLVVGACTPAAGPLGSPATPRATTAASAGPGASDVVPPTPSPTPAPTTVPSPTNAPSTGASPSGTTTPASASPTAAPSPTPAPTGSTIVRAYFMLGSFTDNPGLVPVLRTVPDPKAVASAAMNALLAGPNVAEMSVSPAMYTSIPAGTRVLDLSIADGVATVNLSTEFRGALASFQGSVAYAQVVYTLTQFSTVNMVRIEIDGASQGGAIGRSDFQVMGILPAIFVDRPAWGAAAGNPARIGGLANVFEATFRAQILDGKGTVLADQQVMASCGTGCWGSFLAELAYSVDTAQYGTLRVFNLSARDGSVENLTEYRVWLTPAG